MSDFKSKVALITGANSGIGLATATEFIRRGATVILTARRTELLQSTAEALGSNAIAISADVSKMEELDHLFLKVKEQVGHLDTLFFIMALLKCAQLQV